MMGDSNQSNVHRKPYLLMVVLATLVANGLAAAMIGTEFVAPGDTGIQFILISIAMGVLLLAFLSSGKRQKILNIAFYLAFIIPATFAVTYAIGCGHYGQFL